MFRSLSKQIAEFSWFAITVELIVVVVGVLIALQVDVWSDRQADQELEQVYLERLIADLELEDSRMADAARFAQSRVNAAELLDSVAAASGTVGVGRARLARALETVTWRSFPQISAFVWGELQSTGRLSLIRSEELRRAVAAHYTALEHDARVGEDLTAQHRFESEIAGVLTLAEQVAVERAGGQGLQLADDPARSAAIVRELRSRPRAVAELPNIAQHHVFNLRVISEMRARNQELIALASAELSAR